MFNYHRSQEFPVDWLSFEVDSVSCFGTGFLQWDPDNGFHLSARVEQRGPRVLKRSIRPLSVTRRTILQMRFGRLQRAFAPGAYLGDSHVMSDHLSIDLDRIIFIQRESRDQSKDCWPGQALLKTTTNLTLPDHVRRETKIGESKPRWSLSLSGIDHGDSSGFSFQGLRNEDELEISWSLPNHPSAKQQSWCIPEGLCSALAVLDGTIPQILFREIYRKGRTFREVWKPRQPSSLDIVFRPCDSDLIDRDKLIELTKFFSQTTREAQTSRRMLTQMIEASHQRTWPARELLTATVLEAALRTLNDQPFVQNAKNHVPFGRYLEAFVKKYISNEPILFSKWKGIIGRVMKAHDALRDRNAHPDWLAMENGSDSPEALTDSLNNVITLSRFYGYMMLAMAGFRGLEPRLPIPFDQWPPMLTVEHAS